MAPRLYCPLLLQSGARMVLPAHAVRHVQVLRLQPGDAVELFHGGLPESDGAPNEAVHAGADSKETTGWFDATITHMGRAEVGVDIGNWHAPRTPEHAPIHVACAVPANDRMDWLVEKATELGAASIQPLLAARSVLRLSGERAHKRVAHWQAIAIAACEQSGRTAVPWLRPLLPLEFFLQQDRGGWPVNGDQGGGSARAPAGLMLSLREDSQSLPLVLQAIGRNRAVWLLSGPEGGLTAAEEALAMGQGWTPVSLGSFTLRAETAPVAALAAMGVCRAAM
jgi:16S rRNA (uracil1498-N3)-methyltransferase